MTLLVRKTYHAVFGQQGKMRRDMKVKLSRLNRLNLYLIEMLCLSTKALKLTAHWAL